MTRLLAILLGLAIALGGVPAEDMESTAVISGTTTDDYIRLVGEEASQLVGGGTLGAQASQQGVIIPLVVDWETGIMAKSAYENRTDLVGMLLIPESVTEIGDRAFAGCTGLTGALFFAESLTRIGNEAFEGCTGIKGDLFLPDSVTYVGRRAFAGCTGIKGDVGFSEAMMEIGEEAFEGCKFVRAYVPDDCYGERWLSRNGWDVDIEPAPETTLSEDFSFERDGEGATVTGYMGPADAKHFVIPAQLGALPVTAIGPSAFEGRSALTGQLALPEGLTRIEARAFAGCVGLKGGLVLPQSVTDIGEGAFSGCAGLTGTLTVPAGVTKIGEGAFDGCAFTAFIAPVGSYADRWLADNGYAVTHTIGTSDFLYAVEDGGATITGYTGPADADLIIPEEIDGLPVQKIGRMAFMGRGELTGDVRIPKSVTEIGEGSFSGCAGLTGELTIPRGVTVIGENAFEGCAGLEAVTVLAEATQVKNSAFKGCGFASCFAPAGSNAEQRLREEGFSVHYGFTYEAQDGGAVITGYTGPDDADLFIPAEIDGLPVRKIGNMAFMNRTKLKGFVRIPQSVTEIGESAFSNCRGLTGDLTIPEGVTTIGRNAFWNCGAFDVLSLPQSLTSIGGNALKGCGYAHVQVPEGSYAAQWMADNGYMK